jgi:hypothetical protein
MLARRLNLCLFVSFCAYLVRHCPLGARVIQDHLMNVHGRDGLGTALVLSVGNIEKKEGVKTNLKRQYMSCVKPL